MDRRNFLAAVSSLVGSALVPTWTVPSCKPKTIDLTPFCSRAERYARWKTHTPFIQGATEDSLRRFGTDGKICVRVASSLDEIPDQDPETRPPVLTLAWPKGDERGWRLSGYLGHAFMKCTGCQADKPLREFSRTSYRGKRSRRRRCKACMTEYYLRYHARWATYRSGDRYDVCWSVPKDGGWFFAAIGLERASIAWELTRKFNRIGGLDKIESEWRKA